ncbi:MAG: polysulfide reductase NrfD [Chloroflexi bacterium]|nr:polysulfide reductase NrfD [Chloroflexota bacterium]
MSTGLEQLGKALELRRGGGPGTYYRYPALKRPEWTWEVFLYFFTGGLAAGSYLIATLADLFGRAEDRAVSRVGRYVALGSVIVAPLLLIADLGRRERFLNMLRIVKSRSPMSMGTWGLAGLGVFAGLGVLRQAFEDGLIPRRSFLARPFSWVPLPVSGVLGSLFGFFVGSYTGALLSFTNVPLWAKNNLLQGPSFLYSALTSGLSAISLVLAARGGTPRQTDIWMNQAEDVSSLGEAGMMLGSVLTLGSLARPILSGRYAAPFWLGAFGLGVVAPLALRHSGPRGTEDGARYRQAAAAISALAGGLIYRWVTVKAGQESADDSSAYFTFTGDGRGRR